MSYVWLFGIFLQEMHSSVFIVGEKKHEHEVEGSAMLQPGIECQRMTYSLKGSKIAGIFLPSLYNSMHI